MPVALLALATLLVLNVLLGPLGSGVIQWRVSVIGLNQTYGADGAALVLVVPTALAAAWLWHLRARLAAPLALGVGLATLYYAIASALGPDYIRYDGNNERFFLILLVLIVLSGRPGVDSTGHTPAISGVVARRKPRHCPDSRRRGHWACLDQAVGGYRDRRITDRC